MNNTTEAKQNTDITNIPLSREELAAFYEASRIQTSEIITKTLDKAFEEYNKIFSNAMTTVTDAIRSIGKTNDDTMTNVNTNITKILSEIKEIDRSRVSNIAQIKDVATNSIAELKTILSNRADVSATNETEFQFVSKLTDKEKSLWRSDANTKVRSFAKLCGLEHADAYMKVYNVMAQISGIEVHAMHKKNEGRKFNSTIDMISNSDVLMKYFSKAIRHLMGVYSIDGDDLKKKYNAITAIRCPEIIREQCCRLMNKDSVSSQDLLKLYNLFSEHENLNYYINAAKEQTGYKRVSKGFAISLMPNGYEQLVRIIDEELAKKNKENNNG